MPFSGQNFENVTPDLESAVPRYYICQFSSKTDNFDSLGPNLPENPSPDSESAPSDTIFSRFQPKRIALTLAATICPKIDFEVRI